MAAQSPVVDNNCVQLTFKHSADELVAIKRMKKEPGALTAKSVVVLKNSDVTTRDDIVFMPNTIEMAQLKKPDKGQFKTNVQISSKMTAVDVKRILVENFSFLEHQRFWCAAAVDNRTRLDFHGERRIWDGRSIKRKIKGNSALYIFTDEDPKVSELSTLKRSHDQIASVENEESEQASKREAAAENILKFTPSPAYPGWEKQAGSLPEYITSSLNMGTSPGTMEKTAVKGTLLEKSGHLIHSTKGQSLQQNISDRVVYVMGHHGMASPVSHPSKSVLIQETRNAKDVVTGAVPTSSHSLQKGTFMVHPGDIVLQKVISTASDGCVEAKHSGLPLVTPTVPHVTVCSTLTPQMSNLTISKAAFLQLQTPVDVEKCTGKRDQSAQTEEVGYLSQHVLPETMSAKSDELHKKAAAGQQDDAFRSLDQSKQSTAVSTQVRAINRHHKHVGMSASDHESQLSDFTDSGIETSDSFGVGQIYVLQRIKQDVCKATGDTNLLLELKKIASGKGFIISDNKGGGNCMFHALSEQLSFVKRIQISYQELRHKVVNYLKKNPTLPDGTELFSFVDGYSSWNAYLANMAADGTWGDHVILHGAANCFRTSIHVISSLSHHNDVIINPERDVASSNQLVLGHVHEHNYVSLIPTTREGDPLHMLSDVASNASKVPIKPAVTEKKATVAENKSIVNEICPNRSPLRGGNKFMLVLDEHLPPDVVSGRAYFENVGLVTLEKLNAFNMVGKVPAAHSPGRVTVTVQSLDGQFLGKTFFYYIDEVEDVLQLLVRDNKLQARYFGLLSQELINRTSESEKKQTSEPSSLQHTGSERIAYINNVLQQVLFMGELLQMEGGRSENFPAVEPCVVSYARYVNESDYDSDDEASDSSVEDVYCNTGGFDHKCKILSCNTVDTVTTEVNKTDKIDNRGVNRDTDDVRKLGASQFSKAPTTQNMTKQVTSSGSQCDEIDYIREIYGEEQALGQTNFISSLTFQDVAIKDTLENLSLNLQESKTASCPLDSAVSSLSRKDTETRALVSQGERKEVPKRSNLSGNTEIIHEQLNCVDLDENSVSDKTRRAYCVTKDNQVDDSPGADL